MCIYVSVRVCGYVSVFVYICMCFFCVYVKSVSVCMCEYVSVRVCIYVIMFVIVCICVLVLYVYVSVCD